MAVAPTVWGQKATAFMPAPDTEGYTKYTLTFHAPVSRSLPNVKEDRGSKFRQRKVKKAGHMGPGKKETDKDQDWTKPRP